MDNNQLLKHSRKWDRTGVVVASLCLIHCLAFPLLIVMLPATRAFLDSKVLEFFILSAGISVGIVSFYTSYQQHRKIYPMVLGAAGVVFLTASLFGDPLGITHSHSHVFGVIDPFMILGGLCLIGGHIWNIHACHCFCDRTCAHEEHQH